MDEVEKYQAKNQSDIKEEQERKKMEDERQRADVIEGEEDEEIVDEERS